MNVLAVFPHSTEATPPGSIYLKSYLSEELNNLGHNGNMVFKDEQAQQKSAELLIVSPQPIPLSRGWTS